MYIIIIIYIILYLKQLHITCRFFSYLINMYILKLDREQKETKHITRRIPLVICTQVKWFPALSIYLSENVSHNIAGRVCSIHFENWDITKRERENSSVLLHKEFLPVAWNLYACLLCNVNLITQRATHKKTKETKTGVWACVTREFI